MRIHHLSDAAIVGLTIATHPRHRRRPRHRHGPHVEDLSEDRYPARARVQTGRREAYRQSALGYQGSRLWDRWRDRTCPSRFRPRIPAATGRFLSIGVKCTLDKDALSGEFTVNDGPGGTFSAHGPRRREARRRGRGDAGWRQSRSHRELGARRSISGPSARPPRLCSSRMARP